MRLASVLIAILLLGTVCSTQTQRVPAVDDRMNRLREGVVWLDDGMTRTRFRNIQRAVDAAGDDDTILLSDGFFRGDGNREITVSGKNLTIRSASGPDNCIIDCESQGRAFFFDGDAVTSDSLLTGVTIVRGDRTITSPQVGLGGAILCSVESRPTIENCVFVDCAASLGGAIQFLFGGGAGLGTIRGCRFYSNSAEAEGGAFSGAEAIIDRCVFIGNRSFRNGGALYLEVGGGIVRNCLIQGNEARPDFGSNRLGGGVYLRAPGWSLQNCTIVENFAFGRGGGVAFGTDLTTTITNNVLWGNTVTVDGAQAFAPALFGGGQTTLLNCVVEGGEAGVAGSGNEPLLLSSLDEDPMFLDPSRGDFGIGADSPCVDAGTPAFVPAVNEADLNYEPRLNGTIDVGADEYWEAPSLSLVRPGRANELNSISSFDSKSGACVSFFFGTSPGSFPLPFGGCPALVLDIGDASLLASVLADDGGVATYEQLVPGALSGATLFFQTVVFDGAEGRPICTTSNLVEFRYE